MLNEDAAAARRYLKRAKSVRFIAAETADSTLRSALLRVARDYERMARARLRVGKLARTALRKPSKGSRNRKKSKSIWRAAQ
jgi:hypothetical protein